MACIAFGTLGNESVEYTQGCECHGNSRCKNCLSSPKFKLQHKTTHETNQDTNTSIVHSRDFLQGYLLPEKQRSYDPIDDEVIIRGSIQDMDDDKARAQNLLNKLAPTRVNQKGAIVVEVEKVVRDLIMVHRTVKTAKFFRVLVGTGVSPSFDIDNDALLNEQDQDKIVNIYRELLNHFFKIIVRLNSAIEDLTQNNELYKLKLLNLDLKQQVTDLKKETKGQVNRQHVDDILGFFQKVQQRMDLQQPTKEALEALEFLQFQISKHQFKLNQIYDLFCLDGQINRDLESVEARCHDFAVQGGETFLESTMNPRKSQN